MTASTPLHGSRDRVPVGEDGPHESLVCLRLDRVYVGEHELVDKRFEALAQARADRAGGAGDQHSSG